MATESLIEEFRHFRRYTSLEKIENGLRYEIEVNSEKTDNKKDKPLRCKLGLHKVDKPRYVKQRCLLCGDACVDDDVFSFEPGGVSG